MFPSKCAWQEDPRQIQIESNRAQSQRERLVSTYLTSREGKSRIEEVFLLA